MVMLNKIDKVEWKGNIAKKNLAKELRRQNKRSGRCGHLPRTKR
jgi:hypothetical protein